MTQHLNRWNGNVIAEGEMNLRELILTHLKNGGSLRNADMRNADIDYSAWPLRCSSTKAILCDKLKAQLMYHALCLVGDSVAIPQEMKDFVNNNFHRIGELPKL